MSIKSKADQTIEKLLALTQDRKIEWERTTETRSLTLGTDDHVDVAYVTNALGTHFFVYEVQYQTMGDDERLYWTDKIRVDLVDEAWTLLWRLPSNPMMWDLLEAVRLNAGKVEKRLDDFLKD